MVTVGSPDEGDEQRSGKRWGRWCSGTARRTKRMDEMEGESVKMRESEQMNDDVRK